MLNRTEEEEEEAMTAGFGRSSQRMNRQLDGDKKHDGASPLGIILRPELPPLGR